MTLVNPTADFHPPQRSCLIYSGTATVPVEYHQPNALIVLGRGSSTTGPQNPGRNEAAAAGALVLIYFDITVLNTFGRYHDLFFNASAHGAAIPSVDFGTSHGPAADLRVSHSAAKYKSVLRLIADEHPEASGIFADDQGPNWSGYLGMSATMREQFYQAHVVHAQALNEVMDERGWRILCTNGVWTGFQSQTGGGSLGGFGYPDRNAHGCALFDMYCQENIGWDDFWRCYSGTQSGICGTSAAAQWRMRDPDGFAGHFALVQSDADLNTALTDRSFHTGWVTRQGSSSTHQTAPIPPTTTARDIGLTDAPPPPEAPLPPGAITLNGDGTGSFDLPADPLRTHVALNFRTNPHGTEQHPGWGTGAPYGGTAGTIGGPWAIYQVDDGAAKTINFDLRDSYGAANNPPTQGNTYHVRAWAFAGDPALWLTYPPSSITGRTDVAYRESISFSMPAPEAVPGTELSGTIGGTSQTFGSVVLTPEVGFGSVTYRLQARVVTIRVPVPFEVKEDGSLGAELVWDSVEQRFEILP